MRPEDGMQARYFETVPQRERLLLLGHLVRNARDPLYLRGPAGAGKTVIARQLSERIGSELRVLDIDLSASPDLIAQAAGQLGTPPDDQAALLRAVDAAVAGSGLLLVVDKADDLAVQTLPMISHLQDRGARLLFVGRGGLGAADGEIDCQFVDLPAFDLEQTAEFLRQQADQRADELDDAFVARLHRAGEGRPGPMLEAWAAAVASANTDDEKTSTPSVANRLGRPWVQWVAGGVAAVALISALWFQDGINAWFSPAEDGDQAEASVAAEDSKVTLTSGSAITPLAGMEPVQEKASRAEQSQTVDSAAARAQPEQMAASSPSSRPAIELPEISAPSPQTASDNPGNGVDSDVDPLEAVMRDAQAAAQASQAELGREDAAPKPKPKATTAASAPSEAIGTPAPVAGSGARSGTGATAPEAQTADRKPDRSDPEATAPAAVVADEDAKTTSRSQQTQASSSPAPVVERSSAVDEAEPGPVAVSPVAASPGSVSGDDVQQADGTGEGRTETDGPAPVIDRVPRPTASTSLASSSPPDDAGPQAVTDDGARWLAGREPSRYTLQIIGARDREAVQAFIEGSGISLPYAVFSRDLGGRPWYSLVAGDYPDRGAAIAAKARLPASVRRADIWPRTFGSIPKN